jgi:hypothetical protein
MTIRVIKTGPLFDGRAADWSREMTEEIRQAIGDNLLDTWVSAMDAHFRVNGRVYESTAHVIERDGATVVNDGWGETNDLPYGPWLEGLGSRNSPVTRFPGYHSLRQAAVETERQIPQIAQPIVDEHVERINGE